MPMSYLKILQQLSHTLFARTTPSKMTPLLQLKTVMVDQIQINNIPRNIAFPSASASLQSTEVSCKSNFTKRSTISSQSLEIINKLKNNLHRSNQALKAIKISSKTNNVNTSSYLKVPIAQPINNLYHFVATVPVTKSLYTKSTYHSVNQPTPNNFDLTQLAATKGTANFSSASTPVLKLPTSNLNYSKSFLQSVIAQVQSTLYYKPLMNNNSSPFVCTLNVNLYPAIDASLYISLLKCIPAKIMKILHPNSNNKSGTIVIVTIRSNSIVHTSPNEVHTLYSQWYDISKGSKESLEDYTARAVEYRLNLDDTDKSITNTEFVRKWRQGIGSIIDPINIAIDDLDQTPAAWNENLSIFQLMGTVRSYIIKRSKIFSIPKPFTVGASNNNTYNINPYSNNNTNNNNIDKEKSTSPPLTSNILQFQESNLPPNFSKLESWTKYVKKSVESFSYLKNPTLELSVKFGGTFPTGYYVRRLNNHKYEQCGILNECKKAASANFEQTKSKHDEVPAKRLMYSIPESLTKTEELSHEQEPVEHLFHNNTNNKVTPYSSNVDTFYSFNKTYYVSSLAIRPTQSKTFTNTFKHYFHSNIIDIHNNLRSKLYNTINNKKLCNPFIIARSMTNKFTNTLVCSSRMILDTGATRHMTGYKHLFINLIRIYNKFVTFGDELTQLPIHSVGSIRININNNLIQIDSVLYIPGLNDALFSVTDHIKKKADL